MLSVIETFVIFGRQPLIGMAEVEALFGADKITPVGTIAAIISLDPASIDFSRLGGVVKFGKLLTTLDTDRWSEIQNYLLENVPKHAEHLEEGKLRLGLSSYNLLVKPQQMMATGLTIKKALKASGRSCRLVPNKNQELNSAQVLHNQLTGPMGWELLFVRHGSKTYVGQTIAVQDIEAYADRDHGRPMRDAKVGMLPPKLAQTIVNLSIGKLSEQKNASDITVLDPFCGTGVVLQESILMGYHAYGTDLEPRMVAYSEANIDWLRQTRNYLRTCDPKNNPEPNITLEIADATDKKWKPFTNLACETYLGRPFNSLPDVDLLNNVVHDVNTITTKFLENAAKQTPAGTRICIAVPAWRTKFTFRHLPALDSLEELGYTRVVFENTSWKDLIYHRDNQVVGRELVVLIRK
jgi:tRNA G10  N-methylase Trm11